MKIQAFHKPNLKAGIKLLLSRKWANDALKKACELLREDWLARAEAIFKSKECTLEEEWLSGSFVFAKVLKFF